MEKWIETEIEKMILNGIYRLEEATVSNNIEERLRAQKDLEDLNEALEEIRKIKK